MSVQSNNSVLIKEVLYAVHLHDCRSQDHQRLEGCQLQHLLLVVLLSLQKSPLEFELVPVRGREFTHFLLDCAELVGCYAELLVFDDVEPVDIGWRTSEADLNDYLGLIFALETDEELRTIVVAQVQNLRKIYLASRCMISIQSGASVHL